MDDSYGPKTISDLKADFEELAYLARDGEKKLDTFIKALKKHKNHLEPETYSQNLEMATSLREKYQNILARVKIRYSKECELKLAITEKSKIKDQLRNLQGILGSLVTATDWQSPSFTSSGISQAGIQTGRIYATLNDYKRDQHWDAYHYEQAYKKEYIDAPFKLPIQVYLTQSGQAAFITALTFLTMEQKITGPIAMGSAVYFQNKDLLIKQFGSQAIEVDEMNLTAVEDMLQKYHPRALFFDTLGNVEKALMPDMTQVLRLIAKYATTHTFVVIDNTCLSIAFQPLARTFIKHQKVHLIVLESLNKYHQFGLDRTTAGVVWGLGKDMGKLFDYRENLGTHILDASVHMLPTPNRKMLACRLARLERNARWFSGQLQAYIDQNHPRHIDGVIYTGGSFFTLRFSPRYQRIAVYKRFLAHAIKEAKKYRVPLIGGTSFGLDTTRVYLTALRTTNTTPFIRIAMGTEDFWSLHALYQALAATIAGL